MRWQGRGDAWATPEGTKPWSLTVVQARAWAGGHAWRERCFPPCPAKRRPRRSGAFACFCRAEPMLGCLLQINRAWARLYRWEGRRRHPVPLLLQAVADLADRKSTRLNSSHSQISYAVFCLKKKNKKEKVQ